MSSKKAIINQTAPQPELECWVQGHEPDLDAMAGQVILIEVIQVNCPGCFVHALPETIRLHETYASKGLKVFVIATAFEHFEHNTLNNLERLLQDGDLQGDPLAQLSKADFLIDGKLPYKIPFSVAMDKLEVTNGEVDERDIKQFILSQIPDFFENEWSDERRQGIFQQAKIHLNNKKFSASTFETYQLQGTPSSILIDKKGILKQVSLGAVNQLEEQMTTLLNEK